MGGFRTGGGVCVECVRMNDGAYVHEVVAVYKNETLCLRHVVEAVAKEAKV